MPLLTPRLTVFFSLILGLSIPLQAATPPALSSPSAAAESPLGPVHYGALFGQASVSAGGNASYVLPIELPPGTRGMVPPVTLNYNSNMRNGLLGLGWFLQGPTSQITRCPQTVSQDDISHVVDYTDQDRFCLDGHRLVLEGSGTYGSSGTEYRTETDSFSRIISHGVAGTGPAYFTVETKGGMTQYYGNTDDSAIEPSGLSTVRTWALNRTEDAAGNYYAISYYENATEGAFYPTGIEYTGNDGAGLLPNVSVEFSYEGRPDKPVRYEGGWQITDHLKRLKTIKTYVDSALVSDYRLTYETIGVRPRSRLTEIERCDALGNCQDPIVLKWWATDDGSTFNNYELTIPADRQTQTSNQVDPRWLDLNGDGTLDYVHTEVSGINKPTGNYEVLLSGPGGYQTVNWSGGYVGGAIRYYPDIDADGRRDIVNLVRDTKTDIYNFHVSRSTGSGFTTQLWGTYSDQEKWDGEKFYFRDMNGDKRPDLVVVKSRDVLTSFNYLLYSGGPKALRDTKVYVGINTGSGFGQLIQWADLFNKVFHLADMNGDGLSDVVLDARFIRLNNGSGFSSAVEWPTTRGNYGGYGRASFADYNGDGKADRVWTSSSSATEHLHYNTSASFIVADLPPIRPSIDFNGDGQGDAHKRALRRDQQPYWLDAAIDLYLAEDYLGENTQTVSLTSAGKGMNRFSQVADINGDGIYDYTVQRTWACDTNYRYNVPVPIFCDNNKIRIYHTTGTHQHLLKKVTTGRGAEVEFTYAPLTDHTVYTKNDTAQLPDVDVQDGTQVVRKLTQPDGNGDTFSVFYSYEGLRRDLNGRGNLGFAKITAENDQDGITTITNYAQTFPYSSQPLMTEVRRTSDDLLLNSTDTSYSLHGAVGSGKVFPYVDTRITKAYNLNDGDLLSTSTTNNQVDAYGNITESIEETIDHENNVTFKKQSISTYTIDTSDWRVGQLDSQTVKAWLNSSNDPGRDRKADYTYYASTGFLKDTIQEPGKGSGIESTRTLVYDAFGTVKSSTVSGPGLAARVTSMSYDSRGQFALTMTNPLGHQTSRTWDPKFGVKLSETDPNTLTTAWYYNSFGQQLIEVSPEGSWTVSMVYADNSDTHPTAELYTQVTASGKAPVREFYDLLGRTVRTRTQGFDGRYVNQDTEYDNQGRAYRTSEPYYDGDAIDWNTNTFDFLGRITAITAADPVNSVTSTYDGFTVDVTDAQNRTRRQKSNAVGQVIQVVDKVGTEMTFTYDPAGNRTQVTNAVGTGSQNSVTYTHDRLGRMLTQNDPDHGIYTYTYDAIGQKLSEVSPKMAAASQSVTYEYDLLGRMITRAEPEGVSTWVYDYQGSGNLGLGQLFFESNRNNHLRIYYHGAGSYGRLTQTLNYVDGMSFYTQQAYDSNGRLTIETYPGSTSTPGGFRVEYTYNALGFMERVQAPGGGSVYYQMLETDAAGRPTSEWMGDGSITSQLYDNASSRVTEQHTVNGSTDIQHFSYTYDDAGNMDTRGDMRLGLSESFTFDDLDRLTGAQVAGGTPATYGFDAVGNITEKSDAGNPFLYNSTAFHAVTQVTDGSTIQNLSYDPNGNLSTGDDVPTITWSSYNKPLQLTKGSVTYNFAYGADRARYKKVRGAETTYYIGGGFERTYQGTSTVNRHVIRANGKAVMLRKDDSMGVSHEYIHRDHLGSVTALTKQGAGSVIEYYSYDAWGMRRNPTTWAASTITAYEQRGYTGHEHLDDIGVIHMNGRVYDPRLGRMLSPDPVTQAPEKGQNYNRYTYANNNPLKYTDPSGYFNTPCIDGPCPVNGYIEEVMAEIWPDIAASAGLNRTGNINLWDSYVLGPHISLSSGGGSAATAVAQNGDLTNGQGEIVLVATPVASPEVQSGPSASAAPSSSTAVSEAKNDFAIEVASIATFTAGILIDEATSLPKGMTLALPLNMGVQLAIQGKNPYRQSSDIFGNFVATAAVIPMSLVGFGPLQGGFVFESISGAVSGFYDVFLTGPPRAEDYWRDFQPSTKK